MRLVGQYAIVLATALAVMAWGTSPCLYADIVAKLADHGAGCCCDCCCDPEAPPAPGTDDCPACSQYGNMHELPPVGDPVVLDPPVVDPAPLWSVRAGNRSPLDAFAVPPGRGPPLAAFSESVSLQR